MMNTSCTHSNREASVTVGPLNFQSNTSLFGWHSRFVSKRSQPAVRTPTAFASNLISLLHRRKGPTTRHNNHKSFIGEWEWEFHLESILRLQTCQSKS
jgi:hypothetical protein